jgi:hypothetical protein
MPAGTELRRRDMRQVRGRRAWRGRRPSILQTKSSRPLMKRNGVESAAQGFAESCHGQRDRRWRDGPRVLDRSGRIDVVGDARRGGRYRQASRRLQIPRQSGRGFRFNVGSRSYLIPATSPNSSRPLEPVAALSICSRGSLTAALLARRWSTRRSGCRRSGN